MEHRDEGRPNIQNVLKHDGKMKSLFESKLQFFVFCFYIFIWVLYGQLVTWSKVNQIELQLVLALESRYSVAKLPCAHETSLKLNGLWAMKDSRRLGYLGDSHLK